MGWSFRKSKKIMGVRFTLGKRGVSVSAGGFTVSPGRGRRRRRTSRAEAAASVPHPLFPNAHKPLSSNVMAAILGIPAAIVVSCCLGSVLLAKLTPAPSPALAIPDPMLHLPDAGFDGGPVDAGTPHRSHHRRHHGNVEAQSGPSTQ